ncbi:hypothetical protein D7207_04260 [Burkholderia cepacia]|nr:hypothetical protein [Burkholderia cepacia]MBA9946554.1 hypothetical protein [Burkholderia cepacia]MBA9974351.1 hypothetical protein [Burkholderia cepacia]MBA9995296.1 hypothetical protein [Burkholderia cepacia]MBB0000751.1 hypothetical protein [Burkholderia cepacia]
MAHLRLGLRTQRRWLFREGLLSASINPSLIAALLRMVAMWIPLAVLTVTRPLRLFSVMM